MRPEAPNPEARNFNTQPYTQNSNYSEATFRNLRELQAAPDPPLEKGQAVLLIGQVAQTSHYRHTSVHE